MLTDVGAGPGHPEGALLGADAAPVPACADRHTGDYGQAGVAASSDGQLHLSDVKHPLRRTEWHSSIAQIGTHRSHKMPLDTHRSAYCPCLENGMEASWLSHYLHSFA